MVIQLDNHVIYYEHTGEGQPLLLLHGNKEDHHIFDELCTELEDDFEIFAVDMRGHGLSAKEKEYHYADMAYDIIRLIESLDIQKPLIAGFSDGGIIALLTAIRRSDLISGIIACGPNLSPKALTLGTRMEIKRDIRRNHDPRDEMMLREPDISESDLGHISVPALILAGDRDICKRSHFEGIADAIPGAGCEILKGEDHSSYVIHQTRLAPYIRSMGSRVSGKVL